MKQILMFVAVVICLHDNALAQRNGDERGRYGDSLKFVYIRGHEEGPDLEGEFGAYEGCFHFAGWMGGTFIPVKFRMEADGSRRFTGDIKLQLKCYYSPPFRIAIADNKGNIVANGVPQNNHEHEYTFSIESQPPGVYGLNFYSREDSLVQSIPFRKPVMREK
jgi:hypothetical protein